MKFCVQCGKKNDSESRFCIYCGHPFPEKDGGEGKGQKDKSDDTGEKQSKDSAVLYEVHKIKEKFIELAKKHEKKNGQIMYPIRVALTFKTFTPGGAVEIAHILGKDETIKRIKNAIEKLEKIV